jgi:ABC-2 type transport system ATP-binding protein
MMGLLAVQGQVLLNGQDVFRSRVDLAQNLAYVPQVAPQLSAPVGELVRAIVAVRGLTRQRVAQSAATLELDLAEIDRRPFRALSGGMKQKLLLALALAGDASLLILDEPTASLDPRARERFFSLFSQRAGQPTLVLCSHRLEEIRHLVDHVVALNEGRVEYDGPAADYLGRNTLSLVEVRVDPSHESSWLTEHGFAPRARGWWTHTIPQAHKMELLATLSDHLGARLHDLLVRDLETLQPQLGPVAAEGGGSHA